MPITNTIIAGLLNSVVRRAVIEICSQANRTQLNLDTYVASQLVDLTPDRVESLLFGGSQVAAGFSEGFRKRIARIIAGSLNQSWQTGMQARQIEVYGTKARFVWRTGPTASGTHCPDCAARNGQIETMEQWEVIGAPRSGFSVCNSNCKCYLEPVTQKEKTI